jgi:phospholipid-translocating ATPase
MSFTACIVVISIKLQLIEQRYKSVMAALAIICSVGGWFLWNLILAATYAPGLKYAVRGGIFSRFGPSALWWLALIISIVACCLFEIGIQAITGTFCPTDVEVFQTLEGESDVRERFEEASVMWLRQGWEYRDGKRKYLEEGQNMAAEEQEKREGEVEKLLLSRPSTLEEARGVGVGQPRRVQTEEELVMISDGPRNSVQIDEMLSKRFGNVRREQMTPSN